jgi:hypothetical protein
MAAIRVDLVPVREFVERLTPRIDEAVEALNLIARAERPELGGFDDAVQTVRRYEILHTEHLQRLRRLVLALLAARQVAAVILTTYEQGEELNVAALRSIGANLYLDDVMPEEAADDGYRRA